MVCSMPCGIASVSLPWVITRPTTSRVSGTLVTSSAITAHRFARFSVIRAIIDETGNIRLLEPLHLSSAHRALVTVLDENSPIAGSETALLSELALAADWNRPEEDAAWSHLQRDS
jgi:hypothetical protein